VADTLRLRGDEVQLRITRNGVLEKTLTAIKSCTATIKLNRTSEGYIGEGTNRRDMFYQGIEGNLTFHPESEDALVLADLVKTRASRRTPQSAVKINLVMTATFPNGDKPRISVADLQFADIPFNVGGRENYVEMTYDWGADDYRLGTT
jgi:hypothetical protein